MADGATSERTSAEVAPVRKTSKPASVEELVSAVLDKGIVIESWTSVPVLGLELLSIETRVEVVSVATYLRYAQTILLSASKSSQQVDHAGLNGEKLTIR